MMLDRGDHSSQSLAAGARSTWQDATAGIVFRHWTFVLLPGDEASSKVQGVPMKNLKGW